MQKWKDKKKFVLEFWLINFLETFSEFSWTFGFGFVLNLLFVRNEKLKIRFWLVKAFAIRPQLFTSIRKAPEKENEEKC